MSLRGPLAEAPSAPVEYGGCEGFEGLQLAGPRACIPNSSPS
jgi:hypothetical protein